MSSRTLHGTDCFEVEAFLQKGEVSKLFKVRDKRTREYYCMEVAVRTDPKGSVNTFVQEIKNSDSPFLLNLKFTFQTFTKLYYILQYVSENTLATLWRNEGPLSESRVKFYACDILTALQELHDNGLKYGELDLEKVLIDSSGHAVLARTFCGKKYWLRRECVCDLTGFRLGYPCDNSHVSNTERELRTDFQDLGRILLQLYSRDSLTGLVNRGSMSDERYAFLASQSLRLPTTFSAFARDLVTRLLKGQFYSTDQVKNHPFFHGVKWHEVKARKTTVTSPPRHMDTVGHTTVYTPTQSPYGYDRQTPVPPATSHSRYGTSYRLNHVASTPDLTMYEAEGGWSPTRTRPGSASPRPKSYPDYPEWDFSRARSRGLSNSMTDLRDTESDDGHISFYSRPRTLSMTELNNLEDNIYFRDDYCSPRNHSYHAQPITDTRNVFLRGLNNSRYEPRSYSGLTTPTNFSDFSPRDGFGSTSQFSPRSGYYSREYNRQPFAGDVVNAMTMDRRPMRKSLENRSVSYSSEQEFKQRGWNQQQYLERPPLINRARSCSELDRVVGDESNDSDDRLSISYDARYRNRSNERARALSDRQPMRNDHPLARIPIPSFEEFKRRKSGEETILKSESSSLYGSTDPYINDRNVDSSPNRTERTRNAHDRRSDDRVKTSAPERRGDSYFSKNEVIHNLLLKYGLYNDQDKGDTRARRRRNGVLNNEMHLGEKEHGTTNRRENSVEGRISATTASNASDSKGETGSRNVDSNAKERRQQRHSRHEHQRTPQPNRKNVSVSNQSSAQSVPNSQGQAERPKMSRKSYSVLAVPDESSAKKSEKRRHKSPRMERRSYSTLTGESYAKTSSEEQSISARDKRDRNNNVKSSAQSTMSQEVSEKSATETAHVIKEEGPPVPTGSSMARRSSNLSSVSDLYKPSKPVQRSASERSVSSTTSTQGSEDHQVEESDSKSSKSSVSKTLWGAAKFKLRLGKSPSNSPKSPRKTKDSTVSKTSVQLAVDDTTKSDQRASPGSKESENQPRNRASSSKENVSPRSTLSVDEPNRFRRASAESFSPQGKLSKTGVHTSLLSISSSIYSTDMELDDSGNWQSDGDPLDTGTPRNKKRWDSFHSNVSADSGSAHLFDFETDSVVTEYEEAEPKREVHRPDAEIERTDSGVGGDLGPDPRGKPQAATSWEDIVLKSSKHWSVVSASARHWQELARKKKLEKEQHGKQRKSVMAPVIAENMPSPTDEEIEREDDFSESFELTSEANVEDDEDEDDDDDDDVFKVSCRDCLKHFVPDETRVKSEGDTTSPMICPKCLERRVERKEAIIELVQTEINYGNDLQILKEEFYSPMQSGSILMPDHLAAIFLNLQELVEVNSKFSSRLQSSLEQSVAKGDEEFCQVNVGSIFLESVEFFQSYEIYCSKQSSASVLLESLQKKNELLRIFLNVTCRENPKCRKMDLNSFLLAPVQRIMKYPLLLSRIRKTTPRGNSDREKLMVAQRRIEDQLNRINSSIKLCEPIRSLPSFALCSKLASVTPFLAREAKLLHWLNSTVESKQRRYRGSGHLGRSDSLDKLQMKKMASDILNWAMGEMQLLMHGVFEVTVYEFASSASWNKRSARKSVDVFMLFCIRGHVENITIDSDDEGQLFDEPLFPSETDATDAALVMLKKKVNGKYTLFKEPLLLDACVVIQDSERKDAFEVLKMGTETYIFKATSSRESRRWLKYLRIQAKDLGAWRRRRNGLPNIMIKTI